MIRLRSPVLFVQEENGEVIREYDSESLANFLLECARQVGIDDIELIYDIIQVIDTVVSERGILQFSEAAQLLIKMLQQAGFVEFAQQVAVSWQVFDLDSSSEQVRVPVDEERILEILQNDLFFTHKPVLELARVTASQLNRLDFREVSVELIEALARENWHRLQTVTESHEGKDVYWLIPRTQIAGLLSGEQKAWYDRGVLEIRGVSELFPIICVEINASQLIRQTPSLRLGHLGFWPVWETIVEEIRAWVEVLGEQIVQRLRHLGDRRPVWPVRVILRDSQQLCRDCFAESLSLQKNIYHQQYQILRQYLAPLGVDDHKLYLIWR